jgi:hypothetical protein
VVLAVSAGLNVLQGQRIRALSEWQQPATTAMGRQAIAIGGYSLDGAAVNVEFRGAVPTVIYYFSPTCGWCERNWTNVKALSGSANGRYRVIAVTSARGLRAYVDSRHLEVDVIEGMSENTRRSFAFGGPPHTLVVSPEGLVTHEWRGAYTPRMERQIEELFGILLPGVALPTLPDPSGPSR